MSSGQPATQPRDPWFVRTVVALEEAATVALLCGIILLVVAQVAARFVFGSPFVWTEELARYGLIWLTFMGASYGSSKGRQLSVDVLGQISGRVAFLSSVLAGVATIAACAVLLPTAVESVQRMHSYPSPALRLPLSLTYSAVVVGFALIAFHTLWRLIRSLRLKQDPGADQIPPI